jgi:hypothetical protein
MQGKNLIGMVAQNAGHSRNPFIPFNSQLNQPLFPDSFLLFIIPYEKKNPNNISEPIINI